MTKFNFDLTINRLNTGQIKYDYARYDKPLDAIPMWVADMDFKAPPEVLESLKKTVEHGVFGYSEPGASYWTALLNWYKTRFDWDIQKNWAITVPGVVFALGAAIRATARKGEGVLFCQPVYYPFEKIIRSNNRKPVISELKLINGKYEVDFEDFENKIKQNNVKTFILCSPHNPVSRVWNKQELANMGEICLKHNVKIISDEIHCDFVYAGHKHTVMATIKEQFAYNTITCISPTKTFNFANLHNASMIISNESLHGAVQQECLKTGYSNPSGLGLIAAQAAYRYGTAWLEELLIYLQGNIKLLKQSMDDINCGISLINPEGTYLMWLDCRTLKLTDKELENFFLTKAKIWLNCGSIFGLGGSGFMRMNIACPRATLDIAMQNLKEAAKTLS
ncbi:MAG: pyridoxal phosphate-dependent aminotransferase [Elusimicrobiota bacterium]|jgi:cystathionine beta-lyase|nr:pyridoxal phosphate-dependent aminotransferase [Elusimicrobiota bacterium]